ncbi:MAG: signal transduction histidine kinase/ActR/RegA family two-component response regulator [Candidatus Azotimanducaceae bacterium]|jgi:signal transduction histidine kinase/ActR/RegA family two-component response regulator
MLQDSLNLLRSQFLGLSRVLSTITQLLSGAVQYKDESELLKAATELLINNHNFQYVTVHLVVQGELQLSCAKSTRSLLRGDTDESSADWVRTCLLVASPLLEQVSQPVVKRTIADTFYYSSPIMYQEQVLGVITVNAPSYDDNHSKFLPVFAASLASLVVNCRHSMQLTADVRRRSEELESAWESAKQSDAAKSMFLNNVSHEYLTPLNAINAAGALLSDSTLTSEQQECVDTINAAAQKLSGMVDGTLDLALTESGVLPRSSQQTSILPFLEGLVAEARAIITQPGLALELLVPDSLPLIEVDTKRLRQILTHLVSNAVKFTESGIVSLEVSVLSRSAKIMDLRFRVTDTGIGIVHSDQEKIFGAFHQLNGSSTRPYGGTGLGLALCQRIAGIMGSEIKVESELGRGSSFEFVLQVLYFDTELAPSKSRAKQIVHLATDAVSVLLVEDNIINQKLAARLLERMGCEVDIANDGVDAVDKFSRTAYDVVFMDCQMPNMDGFEATTRIRELEATPGSTGSGHRTPIIALTANVLPEDRDRSFRVGMDEFLTKPVVRQQLQEALDRWSPS